MKKMLLAFLLMFASFIYLAVRVTEKGLYLPKFSVEADNPVVLSLFSIRIHTNFQAGGTDSVYTISLLPVYAMVLASLILVALAYKKKNHQSKPQK
ncbi:hypothetical protein ACFQPF_08050 [Fictibacillus iocasae]|uniref:Uncharacterized protein n=1 Tax=Fictibacillus iocasae TaxID=2715437 RepID=A0ABW2NSJ2_9BACL